MKDPYFIYILDLVFLFIISISFIVINYQIHINDDIKNKDEIKRSLYDIITFIFICFLIVTLFIFYKKYDLVKSILIYNLLNIITPIPETSLMILLPLKRYLNIDLVKSQIILILISCIIVFLNYNFKYFNTFYFGRIFNYLLKNRKSLILFSIISSIIGIFIFQKEIDFYYNKKKGNFENFEYLIICYIILVWLYFIYLYKIE